MISSLRGVCIFLVVANIATYMLLFQTFGESVRDTSKDVQNVEEQLEVLKVNKDVFVKLAQSAASPPIYVNLTNDSNESLHTDKGRDYIYNPDREYMTIQTGLNVKIGEHVEGQIVASAPGEFRVEVKDLLTVGEGLSGEDVMLEGTKVQVGFVSALDEENRLLCLTVY